MKKYLLSALSFLALTACVEETAPEKTYTSVIEPAFTINVQGNIVEGDYVSFTNESRVEGTEIEHCFWHFGFEGQGNWQDTMTPEDVLYKLPGDFTVTLTIKGADGNQKSTTQSLTVLRKNLLPKAEFSYEFNGNTIKITDESADEDGTIKSWNWTITDGSVNKTITEQNPSYTFSGGGKKTITLVVTDDRGESTELSKIIFLRAPVSEFTVNWSIKVAEATANAKNNVVTVAENESKIFLNTNEGKLLSITDDYFEGILNTIVDIKTTGIEDAYVSYPAYADGLVYWACQGTMYAINAATGKEAWKNDRCYTANSAIREITPCVTPEGAIISGADNFGPDGNHITGFKKDGSKTFSHKSPRGAAYGSIVMLKNGVGLANSNRYTHGWIRPDWKAEIMYAYKFVDSSTKGSNMAHPSIDENSQVYIIMPKSGLFKYDLSKANEFAGEVTAAKGTELRSWTCDAIKDYDLSTAGSSLNEGSTELYTCLGEKLFVINTADGTVKKEVEIPGNSISIPAVDNNGSLHILSEDGHYLVFDKDMKIIYNEALASKFSGSVTLSNSGVSYVMGYKEDGWYAMAIAIPGVTSPANSAWAQYGQDSGHTNYQK